MTVGPLTVERDHDPCHPDRPHWLTVRGSGGYGIPLSDHEANRVEAQLAGSTLRIVDAAGNLPPWPDLDSLRDIVDRAELLALTETSNEQAYTEHAVQWTGLAYEALTAAIELVRAHPTTRNEN